jgi:hypothetical protein
MSDDDVWVWFISLEAYLTNCSACSMHIPSLIMNDDPFATVRSHLDSNSQDRLSPFRPSQPFGRSHDRSDTVRLQKSSGGAMANSIIRKSAEAA